MGRKTLRKPNRKETMRPSYFFIVALTAGVLMLVVLAVMFIRNPPKPDIQKAPKRSAVVLVNARAV